MSDERGVRSRVHDLKEAVNTLRLACTDIESGYRFDDEWAQDKMRMISHSIAILEREIEEWVAYLRQKG